MSSSTTQPPQQQPASDNTYTTTGTTNATTNNANLEELQETVSRLVSHSGVQAVLVLNRHGDIVMERTNTDNSTVKIDTQLAAKRTRQLLHTAQAYVQSLQPQRHYGRQEEEQVEVEDPISFVQIRSASNQEIMIAPHQGFVLAVLKRG